jgi:hypothetical protein
MPPPGNNPYKVPVSPPSPERPPLAKDQPPFSPDSSSHALFGPPEQVNRTSAFESRGESESIRKSGSRNPSIYDEPPSYRPGLTDVDEPSEQYQLVSQRDNSTFHTMDEEIQRVRDKDSKLKTHIRRFRFVVRCAHLACRFFCPSLQQIIDFVVLSLYLFCQPTLLVLLASYL